MASQTVAHAHGHVLVHDVHRLHFTMTRLAKNACVYVRPVIKINVVRQRMNSLPFQWSARSVNRSQPLYIRAVHLCHFVAVHAFFDRRNPGLARFQSAGVAIEARDSKSAGVKIMRERDGLAWLIAAREPIRLRVPADA
jgi:hypothetical protein